jgi:hypothetical protein
MYGSLRHCTQRSGRLIVHTQNAGSNPVHSHFFRFSDVLVHHVLVLPSNPSSRPARETTSFYNKTNLPCVSLSALRWLASNPQVKESCFSAT